MKIAVVGTGYVGLVSAVGWAGLGMEVACIDTDAGKVLKVNSGIPPIFENSLETRLRKAIADGRLRAYADYSPIKDADVVLISVGTPSQGDGSMDDKYIRECSASIGKEIANDGKFRVFVVRSTVLPGTTEEVAGREIERASGKKAGADFGLAMIPEFLKEGTALEDFDAPDRVVIGSSDGKTAKILADMHSGISCPKVFVGIKTAEMTKYASNAFLATKISFANEIALMCEILGIDVDEVMRGVGLDSRIGSKFLVAGAGFGGSCFPKDVRAIIHKAKEIGVEPKVLDAVMETNKSQQARLVQMLEHEMGVKGRKIAVLGLAFKAGTDDVRESPAIPTIKMLLEGGAEVFAYDPQGAANMEKIYPGITYAKSAADAMRGADAALLITAWDEMRLSAQEYKRLLGDAPLFDARRVLKAQDAKDAGLAYYCIGREFP